MKKLASVCLFFWGTAASCFGQENQTAQPIPLARSADAEGIAVVKSIGNLLHGTQNDPTPWECEPTLLYAAKYQLATRDLDFVLDSCSVLSLSKRGAVGSNYFDVSNNVARELPKTESKLQRYRNAKQFYLQVSAMRLTYQGARGHYQLSWHVPHLEVLNRATFGLMSEYENDVRNQRNASFSPNGLSAAALSEDYKRTGMEFFDRKYGRGASVALNQPLPWPTNQQVAIEAFDEKTEYALENLTSNPPQREIDGTTFFLLDRTGNLFFSAESDGNVVHVTPLFLEAWLYKKVVRIPLAGAAYTMSCKTSGLFGKSFKCE